MLLLTRKSFFDTLGLWVNVLGGVMPAEAFHMHYFLHILVSVSMCVNLPWACACLHMCLCLQWKRVGFIMFHLAGVHRDMRGG